MTTDFIYYDMDGVLADFERGVEQHYGQPFSEVNKDRFWNEVVASDDIFLNLPPIENGVRGIRFDIEQGSKVAILTSTGGGKHHFEIARQKLLWLKRQDIKVPVCFCLGTQSKASFAHDRAVLIDDRDKVCKAWRQAGGYAIHFNPMMELC